MAGITTGLTNPPISGTTYKNPTSQDVHLHLQLTLAPLLALAASVVSELSPDGATWTTIHTSSYPAGIAAVSGAQQSHHLFVPKDWYYRVTATQATLTGVVGLTNT